MRTTHDKTLALPQNVAADNDLELIVDHRWSNVATARFQAPGDFTERLRLTLDFQDEYATFETEPAAALPGRADQYGGVPGKLYAKSPADYQYLVTTVALFLAGPP